MTPTTKPPEDAHAETLVLLHGIAANRLCMHWLGQHIARPNSHVLNWHYPSLRGHLRDHAAQIAKSLEEAVSPFPDAPVHFVTHSMGCIVARVALNAYRPPQMGRWVMLTPPNQGSHIASTRLGRMLSRWVPAISQLSDVEDSFVRSVPLPQGIEIGVIAASWDWIVRLSSTHVAEQKAHTIVRSIHSGVLFRRSVARLVRHFLDHGEFRDQG